MSTSCGWEGKGNVIWLGVTPVVGRVLIDDVCVSVESDVEIIFFCPFQSYSGVPIADERVGVQVKLRNPLRTRAMPERFCGGDSLRRGGISSVCTFTFTSTIPRSTVLLTLRRPLNDAPPPYV